MLPLARTVMAFAVLLAVVTLPGIDAEGSPTVVLTAGYLAVTVLIELARRVGATGPSRLLIPLDAVWIAAVLHPSQEATAPLAFLVYLHVAAMTLLVSNRAGLASAASHVTMAFAGAATLGAGVSNDTAARVASIVIFAGAVAWSSIRSLDRLRQGRTELVSLLALSTELEGGHRVEEVHTVLLNHVIERLGFDRAAVVSGVRNDVVAAVRAGGVETRLRWPGPGGPVAIGWRPGGETRLLPNLDPSTHERLDALLPWAGTVVVVPLQAERLGPATLVAEWGADDRAERATARLLPALTTACSHAARSLRNATLLAEVEWLATRDGLTGLVNRRVFDEAVGWAVAAARRSGEPLSLVMLDLDHFKDVNDHRGHQTGDDVLRAVGRALSSSSRLSDVVARYGGEEFAVLLPGCPAECAVEIAERLRARVASEVTDMALTASAGVAVLAEVHGTAERLVAAADRALYTSKRRGRDRTTLDRPLAVGPSMGSVPTRPPEAELVGS